MIWVVWVGLVYISGQQEEAWAEAHHVVDSVEVCLLVVLGSETDLVVTVLAGALADPGEFREFEPPPHLKNNV